MNETNVSVPNNEVIELNAGKGARLVGDEWRYPHEMKQLAENLPETSIITKDKDSAMIAVSRGEDVVLVVGENYQVYERFHPNGTVYIHDGPEPSAPVGQERPLPEDEYKLFEGFAYGETFNPEAGKLKHQDIGYMLRTADYLKRYAEVAEVNEEQLASAAGRIHDGIGEMAYIDRIWEQNQRQPGE